MPVPVIFAFGSFLGPIAMIVAVTRGLFREYARYQAPFSFSVACMASMNLTRNDPLSPFLFLPMVLVVLLGCAVVIATGFRKHALDQNVVWAGSALCGAVCALSYAHIPVPISETLAALTFLSGLACFIFWYTQLPRSSRTSSS